MIVKAIKNIYSIAHEPNRKSSSFVELDEFSIFLSAAVAHEKKWRPGKKESHGRHRKKNKNRKKVHTIVLRHIKKCINWNRECVYVCVCQLQPAPSEKIDEIIIMSHAFFFAGI